LQKPILSAIAEIVNCGTLVCDDDGLSNLPKLTLNVLKEWGPKKTQVNRMFNIK
jgi:hypothetical protein